MNDRIRKYVVTVEGADGERSDVPVSAESRNEAAVLAERKSGRRAIAVETRYEIIGNCARCGALIFDGEKHTRKGDDLRCEVCG